MRCWTNGTFARVWLLDTIYRYRDGTVHVEDSVKKVKGAGETTPDEVVAWTRKGVRLDTDLVKKRRKVIDAVALDEERVAAVISEGRAGPRLVIGPPKGPFEHDLPLKGIDISSVAWPGIWADGATPYSDADKPEGEGDRGVRVHANEHGAAIAASTTGHVAVWRPGADELAFAFRVPGQAEARLDAVPTENGVLLTLCVGGREARVVHMDPSGEVLGCWPKDKDALGTFPALRLDDERVLAYDEDAGALALLSLPDLSELTTESHSESVADACASKSGNAVVFGSGHSIYDVSVEDESISIDGPHSLKEAKKAREDELEAMAPKYSPAKSIGPSQIAFSAGKKQPKDPPWALPEGGEGSIHMRLRSGASPGKGITVALSGPAIDTGLVTPLRATSGGKTVDMIQSGKRYTAELPEVDLVQGIAWPLDPKPTKEDEKEAAKEIMGQTHFKLDLVCHGARLDNQLLKVAVSALGSSSAPLKRTRPVQVGKPPPVVKPAEEEE